ncbi:MAG: site-specific DNA-methyltransferase [Bacteroidota bacterium]|nr:site-specific DNA-methyltransferase [Bacteroidota bacterium]
MSHKILNSDSIEMLSNSHLDEKIDLTFLDPQFNQNKDYNYFDDNLPDEEYWQLMLKTCRGIYDATSQGGAIYFMQREKNTEQVLKCLRESGWIFQNLIIWKKKTSAVPSNYKYGKQYQIIAFGTKGSSPRVFNKLRISPLLPVNYKFERENGIYVTDVWDDIRELTSGYYAGDEAVRTNEGGRFHKQQSPISLLLRILLSSTGIGDTVFDPFAGIGTTLVVAEQLSRNSIGIEIDPANVDCINQRLTFIREADSIAKYYKDYLYTENLKDIWNPSIVETRRKIKHPHIILI